MISSNQASPDGVIWRPEDRPCPVCRASEAIWIGFRGGDAHRHGKGVRTNVVCCSSCGCFYSRPTFLPLSNPYSKYSSEEYFQWHDSQQKRIIGEELATFAETLQGHPGRMLEIGCGRGELLEGAKSKGWSVFGVEMTPEFARKAKDEGIEVEIASVQKATLLENRYDVVLLSAILEHLYDPIEILVKVRRALRRGGLVFIDVPNEGSLSMRIGNAYMRLRRRPWSVNLSPTFPPYHVVGFTPRCLRHVLTSTGFKVHTLRLPRWQNNLPPFRSFAERIEFVGLTLIQYLGSWIGMGDGICCWAVANDTPIAAYDTLSGMESRHAAG